MSMFQDVLVIGFVLVLIVVGALLTLVIVKPISSAFNNADIAQVGKDRVADFDTHLPGIFEWILLILYIGLPLIALGLAFTNAIPSFYFWIATVLVFVFSIIGFFVADLWNIVTTPSILSDAASSMPLIDLIFSNFWVYLLLIWFLIGVGTYVKYGNVGYGGFQ